MPDPHASTVEMMTSIADADRLMAATLFQAARALREGCDVLEVAEVLENLGEGCMRSVARLSEFTG